MLHAYLKVKSTLFYTLARQGFFKDLFEIRGIMDSLLTCQALRLNFYSARFLKNENYLQILEVLKKMMVL